MNDPEVLALIPARGGSKSVPNKNIIEVLGKPLIAWTIEQAKHSSLISRVIVSTDSEKIADISAQYGAEVPFLRPGEISGDTSTDLEAFKHALQWLEANQSYSPDIIVHLRATCPVRRIELIDGAIRQILSNEDADSLRSVSVATQSPYKMWNINDANKMVPVCDVDGIREPHSSPRQYLPVAYWQNGYIDIVRPSTIVTKDSMVGDNILPYVVDEDAPDIDYPEDITKVEDALIRLQKNGRESRSSSSMVRHPV